MIFCSKKLIFLHIPKTGGTSIASLLLPFSDDNMLLRKHHDGVNRFGITGEFTRGKHAVIADYRTTLAEQLLCYRIAISIRDPLDRAISLYFGANSWYKKHDNKWILEEPFWDFHRFQRSVESMVKVVDFLKIDGAIQKPDHVIRFNHFAADLLALSNMYGFPVDANDIPHVNISSAPDPIRAQAYDDIRVKNFVKEVFREDYEFLALICGFH